MAFVDVDKFIFLPEVGPIEQASRSSMLRSVVATVEPNVGQLILGCKNFGPSEQTPQEGVTQGCTCRVEPRTGTSRSSSSMGWRRR